MAKVAAALTTSAAWLSPIGEGRRLDEPGGMAELAGLSDGWLADAQSGQEDRESAESRNSASDDRDQRHWYTISYMSGYVNVLAARALGAPGPATANQRS